MRFAIKDASGEVATNVELDVVGDFRLTKRLSDDVVVELALDDVELRGLQVVIDGVLKVRAEIAARAAAKEGKNAHAG